MLIRDATADDWPAIWPFLRRIVAAGETYTWPRDIGEAEARAMWLLEPPGRTVVAVDPDGTVLGTAKMNPNHMGPAAHIASASVMVNPEHAGRGVGRALGEHARPSRSREVSLGPAARIAQTSLGSQPTLFRRPRGDRRRRGDRQRPF